MHGCLLLIMSWMIESILCSGTKYAIALVSQDNLSELVDRSRRPILIIWQYDDYIWNKIYGMVAVVASSV